MTRDRTPKILSLLSKATPAAAAALLLLSPQTPRAVARRGSYIGFDRHDTTKALSAGIGSGVVIGDGEARLAPREERGTLTSRAYETETRFDTLVPSWDATTPDGTCMRLEVRVRSGSEWTRWFDMGVWTSGTGGPVERQSVDGQEEGSWRISTDTLESIGPVYADAYQYRLTLRVARPRRRGASPSVRGIFVTVSDSSRHGEPLGVEEGGGYRDLPVPERSQMVYPEGGEVWCSPASLSMVMAYWSEVTGRKALERMVPTVARGTYDSVYKGNGNWPFNTAYASSFGLQASVNRISSLGQAERWVASGVPLVASIAWDNDKKGKRLTGAPLQKSDGHLLVVRGFDPKGGCVIVNDPAGRDASEVRRLYRRDEFARAWFAYGSGGVFYLIHPRGWRTPDRADAKGSW